MKIAVVGAGGIGGYFGARWAQAGLDITLLARGAQLHAIQERGLEVHSSLGDAHLPVRALETAAELGAADVVIFATKSWQLPGAVESARALVGSDTVILGLQNGVESAGILQQSFGAERVLGATCRIIAFIEQPGVIRHAGGDPIIFLGELAGGISARVERVVRVLGAGRGMAVESSPDIQLEIWKKFHWFSALAGVGSVARATAGELRSVAQTRALLERAMDEVYQLAKRRGVPLPADLTERGMAFVDSLPEGGTSSMMRDFRDGRRTELESLSGAVVRLAAEGGVDVPVHSFIYGALLPQEFRARSAG